MRPRALLSFNTTGMDRIRLADYDVNIVRGADGPLTEVVFLSRNAAREYA